MQILRNILLTPLSWVYGLAVGLRHLLYDMHILPTRQVNVSTICVGNLSVGGTGKTPHIEWLIRQLSPTYKVAVLSRGYRRQSCGFVLANADSTAREIGDECMQIHTKFPHIPVAVCKDRVEGVRQLRQRCPEIDVVLLDDAYQYRRLRCGFYILLTTADNLYVQDHLLPLGRLRDFAWQSEKANAVVVTKCEDTMTAVDRRVVSNCLRLPAYQSLYFSKVTYQPFSEAIQSLPATASVALLTGIARPEYLERYIGQRFQRIVPLTFADHHRFTKNDLARIEQVAATVNVVFTTEKDYARLANLDLSDTLRRKLYPIEIEVSISDEDHLLQSIHRYLKHA